MSFFDGDNDANFYNQPQPPVSAATKTSSANWAAFGIAAVSLLMSLVLLVFFVVPRLLNNNTDSGTDLYSAPRDLASVVADARAATVTVYCGDWSGSGWGIDLADSPDETSDDAYPYEIVTNFHVIEDCANGRDIWIRLAGVAEAVPAFIYSYDKAGYDASRADVPDETDLALLMTATEVPSLPTATLEPMPGDWLMAVGNPNSSKFDDMEGHVTFGRVSNFKREYNVVVTDTAVNHGNSGGPLLNSRGEVVGTNTWIDISQQAENIAYALAIPKLCEKLIACMPGDAMLWGQ